jgi:predicted kinase
VTTNAAFLGCLLKAGVLKKEKIEKCLKKKPKHERKL